MSVFNLYGSSNLMNVNLDNITKAGENKIVQIVDQNNTGFIKKVNQQIPDPLNLNVEVPLSSLPDCANIGTATNGQVLGYDSGVSKWKPTNTVVPSSPPNSGDFIQWVGPSVSAYISTPIIINGQTVPPDASAGLDLPISTCPDVNVNTPDTGYALLYNTPTLQWTGAYLNVNGQDFNNSTLGTCSLGLDQLADVNINANDHHMLQYDPTTSKYISVPSSTVNAFLGWDSSGYALGKDFGTFIATNYMGSQKGCMLVGQNDGVVQAVYPGGTLSGATLVWDSSAPGSGVVYQLGNPQRSSNSLILYYNAPGTAKTYTAATINAIQPLDILFSSGDITNDNLGVSIVQYDKIGFQFTSLGVDTVWNINVNFSVSQGLAVGSRIGFVIVEDYGLTSQLIYTQTQVYVNMQPTGIISNISLPIFFQYSADSAKTYSICAIPDNITDWASGFSIWSYSLTCQLA